MTRAADDPLPARKTGTPRADPRCTPGDQPDCGITGRKENQIQIKSIRLWASEKLRVKIEFSLTARGCDQAPYPGRAAATRSG
jgi:hypothetical protein